MDPFTYESLPGRVVFGPGRVSEVAAEVEALGGERVFLVVDAQAKALGDAVADQLGPRLADRWGEVAQHVPVELAERARASATDAEADLIVCMGGGSSTGLAKALALSHRLPIIAVPTTYAGSEMTPIYGLTGGRHKQTGKDLAVLPKVVIYDPELTLGLPTGVTGPSACNALAHCVEALYGPGANPVVSLMALEGVRALHRSLPVVCAAPADLEARTGALYGAYLAATALASAGTGLHHKTCHVLGGMFGLDHGGMNAVVLGHALAYNAPAIPDVLTDLEAALGTDDAPGALHDLAADVGAPTSLSALGMPEDGLDEAARRVVAESAASVRPPELEGIRRMLDDAHHGRRPRRRPRTTSRVGWRTQRGPDDGTRQQRAGAVGPPVPPGGGRARAGIGWSELAVVELNEGEP